MALAMTRANIEDVLSALSGVKKIPNGWMARCPAHEDRSPSLSIALGEDGRVWLRGSTPSTEVDDQDRVYRAGAGLGVAAEGWGERGIFYVLSPDGSSVRAFRTPFPIEPMFARGDTVWAHYESAARAQKVGRFTVTW